MSLLKQHWQRGADDGLRAPHLRQGLLLRPRRPAGGRVRHAAQGYHQPGSVNDHNNKDSQKPTSGVWNKLVTMEIFICTISVLHMF